MWTPPVMQALTHRASSFRRIMTPQTGGVHSIALVGLTSDEYLQSRRIKETPPLHMC